MEADEKPKQAVDSANDMQLLWAIVTGATVSSDRRAVRGPSPDCLFEHLLLLVFKFGVPIVMCFSTPSGRTEDEVGGRSCVLAEFGRVIRVAKSWRVDPIIAQYCMLSNQVE